MDPIAINTNLEVDSEAQVHVPLPPEVLATLVEIGEEINSSLDLDDVLARAAALIKRLIDYEIFAVLLLDEKSNELYFRFAIGHNPEVVQNWRIPVGHGLTGRSAASRQALRVPDVSKEPTYLSAVESVRSEMVVPMLFEGRCIGVLDISSKQLDYFTRDQQNILTLLASRIAGAIENARLYQRSRRQAETLALLNEVGREVSSILDLDELLRRAAELVKRIIDYQILSLLLYDEKRNIFSHYIDVKYGQRVQGKLKSTRTQGIVGAAATTKKPVVVPDVTADPRYINENPETRSELAVPLLYKNRVIGVLDLESPQLNYFNEDHVQALSTLAAQLAVALENARLYERVARDEARMERELRAARSIQAVMLPSPPSEDYGLEIASRYVSARELGGDLYDFIRYGPQQLGVALGDVSGKGTAAALYGAVATGILRSLAPLKLQPAEMLKRLNQFVCEQKVEDRFITLCFATWQRGRGRLRVANAGQSQPLLYQNGRCEKIPVIGFPIGIFDEVAYEEWSTALVPGDVVVFYSDGLTETLNPDGEQFGTERLRELVRANGHLSANALGDALTNEVLRFAQGAPAADDRTLLVLKVR